MNSRWSEAAKTDGQYIDKMGFNRINISGLSRMQRNRFEWYTIGVDREILDAKYASQHNTMACWAATLRLAISIHGLAVNQREFTSDLCGLDRWGRINDCSATANEINMYLNGCDVDNFGVRYCVKSTLMTGTLPASMVIHELLKGNPIVVAYDQPGVNLGHAELLTGALIRRDQFTGKETVERLILRDPANTIPNRVRRGRHIVETRPFVDNIYAWWVPQISVLGYNRRAV